MNSEAKNYFHSGNLLKEKGEIEAAIGNYQKALEVQPDYAEVHNQLGEIYLSQGKLAEAIASLQLALKLQPNFARTYKTLGNALQAQGNLDGAIRAYNKAVELDPQFAEAYANIGSMLSKQGKVQEAIAYFQKAIALKPNLAAVHWNLGNALNLQKQPEQAIACWRKAAELQPEQFSAEVYNDRGTTLGQGGRLAEAIDCYQRAIQLKPDYPLAYLNLGTVLQQQGKLNDAIAQFQKALELNPDYLEAYKHLGNALIQGEKFEDAIAQYQKVAQLQPDSAQAQFNFGTALLQYGKLYEAIAALEKAIELQPDYADAYCNLGIALDRQLRQLNQMNLTLFNQALSHFKKAIEINPNLLSAHLSLSDLISKPFTGNTSFAPFREAADSYLQSCGETGKLIATATFITTYLRSGLYQVALDKFLEIEPEIYNADFNQSEAAVLYAKMLFSLPYLRDEVVANNKLAKFIGTQYADKILNAKLTDLNTNRTRTRSSEPLKIGILSCNFYRHSVGWCSADIIQELSKLTPHLYLYSTSQRQPDDRTKLFQQAATKFYRPNKALNNAADAKEVFEQILLDELDILIDLDSITALNQVAIIHQKPAPVCLSWLGFEAPFISEENYYLGDRHTHPSGIEEHYCEPLIRMPDSFVAVAGFECRPVDRKLARRGLRIAEDQVVYLCIAPAYKLNPELIKAQINILKQVPDSILMYKGHTGDIEVIQSAYRQECEAMGVGVHRVKFLPLAKSEEEHRMTYKIADILLDSYPYNGATHTLEALWFNLPVVTRTGEQYLSRMGYSFLQTLSLPVGIAKSWEEYVECGIKLGKNIALRQEINEQLIQSKQPEHLAPLWNPKKFAQDMYALFEQLLKIS